MLEAFAKHLPSICHYINGASAYLSKQFHAVWYAAFYPAFIEKLAVQAALDVRHALNRAIRSPVLPHPLVVRGGFILCAYCRLHLRETGPALWRWSWLTFRVNQA